MPELPEVETIVRDLAVAVSGAHLGAVKTGHPSVFRYPDAPIAARLLSGRTITTVSRRGKYIVCHLDSGDDLVVHLGMTGHLTVCEADAPLAAHTHLRAKLGDSRELRFDDARRFGRIIVGTPESLRTQGVIPALGIEPLSSELTGDYLRLTLRRSHRTLKTALLDQRIIAGLGNIYCDEVCHLAGVLPTKRCHRLTRKEYAALCDAIPVILTMAIANRGTSFDDYRDVWNAKGKNQERLQVYGRAGGECFRDGASLRSAVVGGRTTVWCPACQR